MPDKLIIQVVIDEVNMDGWQEWIEEISENEEERKVNSLYAFFEFIARQDVYVVFTGVPGEKEQRDDFEVYVKPGQIIGVEVVKE